MKTELDSKIDVTELVKQIAQQLGQQIAEQTLQAAQQTGGSLSADKKVLGADYVTEDTGSDEAVKGKTYVDSELWGFNKKSLVEKSQDFDRSHKALEIQREQIRLIEDRAIASKNASLQHVEAIMALANAYSHLQNVHDQSKFNAAVSEPLSPNTKK